MDSPFVTADIVVRGDAPLSVGAHGMEEGSIEARGSSLIGDMDDDISGGVGGQGSLPAASISQGSGPDGRYAPRSILPISRIAAPESPSVNTHYFGVT